MKRYILMFIVLLVAEQLAQTLISAFAAPDLVIRWGLGNVFLRFGSLYRWDSPAAGLTTQPYFLVSIFLFGSLGYCYERASGKRDWLARGLFLSAAFLAFQMATQSLDFIARGYVLDYFGWGQFLPDLWSLQAHTGDLAMFVAYPLGYVSTFGVLVTFFIPQTALRLREMSYGLRVH